MKALFFFLFVFASTSLFSQNVQEINLSGVGTYPNPFNEQLFVQHKNAQDDDKIQKIEIFSETGNLVLSVNRSNIVETSRINNGVYILKIHYKEQIIVRKVVKK
jgi:hypothetical protein